MSRKQRTPEHCIHKARFHLLMKYAFFGNIALGFELIESESTRSMATNGHYFKYNPDFVVTRSTNDLIFVLLHEILHVMLLHHVRFKPWMDKELYNIAADYVVNLSLVEVHGLTMPDIGIYDKRFKGKTVEQVYKILYDELDWKNQQSQGDQEDKQSKDKATKRKIEELKQKMYECGVVEQSNKPEQVESNKIDSVMVMAHNMTKNIPRSKSGIPISFQQNIKEIKTTSAPWKSIIRDLFNRYTQTDYSYRVPDRRFAGEDVIMPSLRIENSLDFIIAIDTSYSVLSSGIIRKLVSQTRSLLDEIEFDNLHIIYCSDEVSGIQSFTKMDEIKLDYTVGGYTEFKPTFDAVKELGGLPACLVYFTDLECGFDGFGPEPPYPVIWAAYGNSGFIEDYFGKNYESLPFGMVVKLPESETAATVVAA